MVNNWRKQEHALNAANQVINAWRGVGGSKWETCGKYWQKGLSLATTAPVDSTLQKIHDNLFVADKVLSMEW